MKKSVIISLIISIIFFIIISSNLISGIIYYVSSSSGDDSNNGTSETSAFQSLRKINSLSLNQGDVVLFKSGDSFRPLSSTSPWGSWLVLQSGVNYSSYGTGAKPIFYGSIKANNISDWDNNTGTDNVWMYNSTFAYEIGNIIFNNESGIGIIKTSFKNLSSQGDFFYNFSTKNLFLYSIENPSSYYSDIELAMERVIFNLHNGENNISIENLNFKYSSYNAFDLHETYNVQLKNNWFSYIGGAQAENQISIFGYAPRWGNAIEIWEDNYDILIENNKFNQIYDTAIGIEGSSSAYNAYNIIIRNNIILNSEECIITMQQDFYDNNTASIKYSILKDLTIENNTCYNIGNTWANEQRAGNNIGRCFWMGVMEGNNSIENGKNITIKNNICHISSGNYILKSTWFHSNNISFDYNLYYKENSDENPLINWGTLPQWAQRITFNSFSEYQNNLSQDLHSAEANPLFVDANNQDFRLSSISPACEMSSTGSYVGAYPCLVSETNNQNNVNSNQNNNGGGGNSMSVSESAIINNTVNNNQANNSIINENSNNKANQTSEQSSNPKIITGLAVFNETNSKSIIFSLIVLAIITMIIIVTIRIVKARTRRKNLILIKNNKPSIKVS